MTDKTSWTPGARGGDLPAADLDAADPPMGVLHTTDFLSRWEGHPYSHWSDEQKNDFLGSLVRVITHHVDYACAAVFLPSGLAALKCQHVERSVAGKPSLSDNPYEICADFCVGVINMRLERTGQTSRRVAYFFEHGDPGQGIFHQSITGLMRRCSLGAPNTLGDRFGLRFAVPPCATGWGA